MKIDLKKFLKQLKLRENNISMVLGAVVIIIVGILLANYFKTNKKGEITNNSTSTETSEIGKTHTVIKGETLWSIAENSYGSGYNWIDVSKANNLKSDQIEVGQKLVIPDVAVKKLTTTTKVSNSTTSVETKTTSSYKVVKGDSLWKIAVNAYGDGYKWIDIAKANNLKNPGIIHPGNLLTLPK